MEFGLVEHVGVVSYERTAGWESYSPANAVQREVNLTED
jgi:hypothetical protein